MTGSDRGRDFYIATEDEIRTGKTTDVYFLRTLDILKKAGKDRTVVDSEVTTGGLPNGWPWGVVAGFGGAARASEGQQRRRWSPPDGALLAPRPHRSRTPAG